MSALLDASWWVALASTFVVSALLTWLAIRYARWRNLVDLPGQRRSHVQPTPRGGGIGIVVSAMLACILVGAVSPEFPAWSIVAGMAIVAAVGWIDDHRGLHAGVRLLAHFAGCAIALLPVLVEFAHAPHASPSGLLFALALLALVGCVWSVNLHNFMDGIDGLLALQTIFVLCALAFCEITAHPQPKVSAILLWAVAVAGFVPFNFPRARIFMGDVGSGVLGLLVGIAVAWQIGGRGAAFWSGMLACSAFVTDATCTLVSRVVRGRRWYSAHREHLYQWLVRGGFSHAQVVAFYMVWNLCIVAPVLYLANRDAFPARYASVLPPPQSGLPYALAVYAAAIALWVAGKRWILRRARSRIE
ncbi:MAG: glycosyltransferase family 4 protein [Rudaea sp.]